MCTIDIKEQQEQPRKKNRSYIAQRPTITRPLPKRDNSRRFKRARITRAPFIKRRGHPIPRDEDEPPLEDGHKLHVPQSTDPDSPTEFTLYQKAREEHRREYENILAICRQIEEDCERSIRDIRGYRARDPEAMRRFGFDPDSDEDLKPKREDSDSEMDMMTAFVGVRESDDDSDSDSVFEDSDPSVYKEDLDEGAFGHFLVDSDREREDSDEEMLKMRRGASEDSDGE